MKVSDYKHGLVVPTLTNFTGLAELFASVDRPVQPFVIPNWRENNCVAASWKANLARRYCCTMCQTFCLSAFC